MLFERSWLAAFLSALAIGGTPFDATAAVSALQRAAWQATQIELLAEKLVFIDETWASTNMAPRYGRGPLGQKVLGAAPFGHWKTRTFLA